MTTASLKPPTWFIVSSSSVMAVGFSSTMFGESSFAVGSGSRTFSSSEGDLDSAGGSVDSDLRSMAFSVSRAPSEPCGLGAAVVAGVSSMLMGSSNASSITETGSALNNVLPKD